MDELKKAFLWFFGIEVEIAIELKPRVTNNSVPNTLRAAIMSF